MTDFPSLSKQSWPKEPGELEAFYGDPRSAGWEAANLVEVPVPWAMQYSGAPVKSIRVHRKCAASLGRILTAIWDYYGHDQAKIDAGHLNEFGGSFNIRANRNNPNQLSVHSYGAALDIAPAENPNGKAWTDNGEMMPRPVIDAFLTEGWAWGGRFSGTKDCMHFQATFDPHAGAAAVAADPTRPLISKGSSGAAVSAVQAALGITTDGYFGSETDAAVRAFQAAHGLEVDGDVGPLTWAALLGAATLIPPAVQPAPPASLFEAKAPGVMRSLMTDFGMRDFHAAGILGNIGQESGGFTIWQQVGKEPPAGGWGWCQWDGERRRAFDAWVAQQGLDPKSDKANYGFLVRELQTTEKAALAELLATTTVEDAAVTFSRKFERPGIPHEDRRITYARQAMAAYRASLQPAPSVIPPIPQPQPTPFPAPPDSHPLGSILAAVIPAILNALGGARMPDVAMPAPPAVDPNRPPVVVAAGPHIDPAVIQGLIALAIQYGPTLLAAIGRPGVPGAPVAAGQLDIGRILTIVGGIAAALTGQTPPAMVTTVPVAPVPPARTGLGTGIVGVIGSLAAQSVGWMPPAFGDKASAVGQIIPLLFGGLSALGATGKIDTGLKAISTFGSVLSNIRSNQAQTGK